MPGELQDTQASARFQNPGDLRQRAAQVRRVAQAYAACQVCSPSRASILTGKYPPRTGITDYLGARFPVPDQEHDPAKRAALLERRRAELMPRLEAEHARYLDPGWEPNPDWWGSRVVRD